MTVFSVKNTNDYVEKKAALQFICLEWVFGISVWRSVMCADSNNCVRNYSYHFGYLPIVQKIIAFDLV